VWPERLVFPDVLVEIDSLKNKEIEIQTYTKIFIQNIIMNIKQGIMNDEMGACLYTTG